MADLLFELDEPQRREREFRLHDMTLDNFTDEELRCRYRFGRESIEFLSDLLANDLRDVITPWHPWFNFLLLCVFMPAGASCK